MYHFYGNAMSGFQMMNFEIFLRVRKNMDAESNHKNGIYKITWNLVNFGKEIFD